MDYETQEKEPWYMNGGKEEWIERMKLYDPEGYAEWLIERREKDRIRLRNRYANLTEEKKEKLREKDRKRYANLTREQKDINNEKRRIRNQKKRDEKRKAELKDDNPPLSFL